MASFIFNNLLQFPLKGIAREHFEGAPWAFQQNSAPSHGWIQATHPGVHQQGRLVLKNPGPVTFGLFGVVHPREQGLPNIS